MSQPLFSVITPTFRSGAKVVATAASVLTQEANLAEFLVVDGGSQDDTLDHLRNLGSAVQWISEPDTGIYDAMNKGIRRARGRFLYFLGAGDRLRPGVLRQVADAVARLGEVDERPREFVYGDVHWSSTGQTYGGEFDEQRLIYQNISHQAIFYGRGIFDLVGEYDLRYKLYADFALNIRCFGQPAIRRTHLDLLVADFEGGGRSDAVDEAFHTDFPTLARQSLGFGAGLRAIFYHARRLRWLNYQLRQPWRTLPARLGRRLFSRAR